MLISSGRLIISVLVKGSLDFLQAVQTALQRLEEGCSIEEAKTICDPGVLHQLFIWQVEIPIQHCCSRCLMKTFLYLSPFPKISTIFVTFVMHLQLLLMQTLFGGNAIEFTYYVCIGFYCVL